jgi:hypothetical protein
MNLTVLQKIQNDFEKIYRVNLNLAITDFLINKKIFSSLYDQSHSPCTADNIRGMTLLYPDDKSLDVAVYIQEKIIANLQSNDPSKRLDLYNISDFFVLAEEVSHFMYAAWKAKNYIPITHLELELQAEVDKFILSSLYLSMQNQDHTHTSLKEVLFADPFLQDGITSEQRRRYLMANHFASRYCHFLEKTYLRQAMLWEMIEEVRIFYRLNQAEKLSSINQKIFYH